MEIEIKLAVPSDELFAELQAAYPAQYVLRMEADYYDTPRRELRGKKWMLRRRSENGRGVVTFKTPGKTQFERGEWELEAEDAAAVIPTLVAMGAPAELLRLGTVFPSCGSRYVRHAALLTLDGCTAELALDRGEVFGGTRTAPIRELEIELKTGDPAAVYALADELSKRYGLSVEFRSKYARAAALCD